MNKNTKKIFAILGLMSLFCGMTLACTNKPSSQSGTEMLLEKSRNAVVQLTEYVERVVVNIVNVADFTTDEEVKIVTDAIKLFRYDLNNIDNASHVSNYTKVEETNGIYSALCYIIPNELFYETESEAKQILNDIRLATIQMNKTYTIVGTQLSSFYSQRTLLFPIIREQLKIIEDNLLNLNYALKLKVTEYPIELENGKIETIKLLPNELVIEE
jgi:hypothetical protein